MGHVRVMAEVNILPTCKAGRSGHEGQHAPERHGDGTRTSQSQNTAVLESNRDNSSKWWPCEARRRADPAFNEH